MITRTGSSATYESTMDEVRRVSRVAFPESGAEEAVKDGGSEKPCGLIVFLS